MSADPSPSAPRIVRTARLLGYLAAVLGAADLVWCLLAHESVAAAEYTIGMMLLSAAAVVCGIFSFLIQTDHRRAKREARRHAESMEVQRDILANQRRILGRIVELEDRVANMTSGQGLLRNQVEQSIGWMQDVGKGVMHLGEMADKAVVNAHNERAGLQHKLGQLPGMVGEIMIEVIGPFVVEAISAAKKELREEFAARVQEMAERVKADARVVLDMPNADAYELGREIGREEAMRERGEDDPKR